MGKFTCVRTPQHFNKVLSASLEVASFLGGGGGGGGRGRFCRLNPGGLQCNYCYVASENATLFDKLLLFSFTK